MQGHHLKQLTRQHPVSRDHHSSVYFHIAHIFSSDQNNSVDPLKSCHKDIVRKEFTPPEGGYLLALFYFLWTLLQTDMKRRSFFSEIGNMRLLRNCVYHSLLSNRGTVYILISSSESPPDMCCPFSSRLVEKLRCSWKCPYTVVQWSSAFSSINHFFQDPVQPFTLLC